MLLFILAALLIAKIKGRKVACVFSEISLLPLWILEIVFWVFQVCAWSGNYIFVPYGSYLETAFILSLLWPVLKYGLYRQAIVGAALTGIGTLLNRIVTNANGGAMPVYPTLSLLTGYYTPGALTASGDTGHMLLSETTKLNFLADYIDVGFSVMSIGDVLIHAFITIVLLGVIGARNRDSGETKL